MNNYASWYVVLWRLPWFVVMQILRVLVTVVAFCGWGTNAAVRNWGEFR